MLNEVAALPIRKNPKQRSAMIFLSREPYFLCCLKNFFRYTGKDSLNEKEPRIDEAVLWYEW